MASFDLQSETNWDIYEASLLIAKNIQECRGWTKRVPAPDQHPNRYDNELPVLRVAVTFVQWLQYFVNTVYRGMYNPSTCRICYTCFLPGRSMRALLGSLRHKNRMGLGDYFYNDCDSLDTLRFLIEEHKQDKLNLKSNIIEHVVRIVVHDEHEERCCEHKSEDASHDTLEEVECALTKVLEDNIDNLLDLIVTLTVANTYHTAQGSLTDDPHIVASKYDDEEYFAPEEAGLVVAHKLFGVLEKMTKKATALLINTRKDKMKTKRVYKYRI